MAASFFSLSVFRRILPFLVHIFLFFFFQARLELLLEQQEQQQLLPLALQLPLKQQGQQQQQQQQQPPRSCAEQRNTTTTLLLVLQCRFHGFTEDWEYFLSKLRTQIKAPQDGVRNAQHNLFFLFRYDDRDPVRSFSLLLLRHRLLIRGGRNEHWRLLAAAA